MRDNNFGEYLKKLRKLQNTKMTQADLGKKVGCSGQNIYQFESGRNDPPQGELLERIIAALDIEPDQATTLMDLSALSRGTIPADILPYFCDNENLRKAIRMAMEKGISNKDWQDIQFGKGE